MMMFIDVNEYDTHTHTRILRKLVLTKKKNILYNDTGNNYWYVMNEKGK